ncbi:hypothetical protein HPB50_017917 [Hyalomma asiaticum]|uniref:Uncharacterized protein n=1 Tax=Hyalomma asiaticum TaxID=266040 RepID=A0ACB7T574_HYAAI|nr:hypothetical protein HPB50_017917 [Hyalomma asiaticum]
MRHQLLPTSVPEDRKRRSGTLAGRQCHLASPEPAAAAAGRTTRKSSSSLYGERVHCMLPPDRLKSSTRCDAFRVSGVPSSLVKVRCHAQDNHAFSL